MRYMAIDIKRINELAKKAKAEGLTPAERAEQAKLRREYIDSVVGNLRAQLDNIEFVGESPQTVITAKSSDSDDKGSI